MPRTNNDIRLIDRAIGLRIKTIRLAQGLSRLQLSKSIGVSHQQLAKYENGENRITAARLCYVAQALKQSIMYFINEADEEVDFVMPRERMFIEIARNFAALKDRKQQQAFNRLLKSMISEEEYEKSN